MRIITKLVLIFYICLLHSITHARTGNAQRVVQSAGFKFADSQNGTAPANTPKVENSLSEHGNNKTGVEEAARPTTPEQNLPQYRSAAEQQISYDNVYGLELTLPFAGNVEVSAAAKDEINVKLEKYGTGANEEFVQTYLDAVQIEVSTKDEILVLTPRAPESSNSDTKLTRLNCLIETPPDLTLKIKTESGDIRVHGIRGDMVLTTTVGNVHLDEVMGAYQVSTQEGRIYGKILLTGSDNTFETQSGSIDLVVLDEIAAEMTLTARGGAISLRLPESYPADIEMQVEDDNQRAISIDLPVELEAAYVGDIVQGWINDGGPLIQMTAGQGITIRPSQSVSTESEGLDNETEVDDPYAEDYLPAPPTVDIPRAPAQPVIDGDLFEKAWAKSVPLSPFYQIDAITQPNKPTQGFLLWDEQYLYIGARVYDSQMKQVQITQTNADSAVWLDDTLELLVDPDPKTPTYHHLVINPIGTVFDQHIRADYPLDPNLGPAYEKIAKPNWDSRAQVKTQITPTFWSVEIALPRDTLEPSTSENWRFNLHRKTQDNAIEPSSKSGVEYSYWSPTFDEVQPWWPHWPDRMGIIRLAETEKSESAQNFEFVEQFSLVAVEVEGNSNISTLELLEKIPFQPGDIISIDELSWLNREFEALDWFSDVRIETSEAIREKMVGEGEESPPTPIFKVNLRIHVTEAPTSRFTGINIQGNRYFISPFLRAAFGLKRERTSIESLNTKCQLIENLYRHHGYDLVQVTHQFSDTHLLIDIDEGHLDDIRFSGYRRITRAELADALDFTQGDAYSKQIGIERLNQMRTRLNNNLYFKRIKSWGVKREGDRNVLAVEVEEQSRLKVSWRPVFDFNRVHGLILGGGGVLSTREANAQIYGKVSNGLSSKIWNYQLGAEKTWFDHHALTVGGSVYQRTDTNRYAGWSQGGEFLGAFFLGSTSLDYHQRKGYHARVKGQLTQSTDITLEFTDEDHEILFKSTDWSLLNKNVLKRSNLRIDEGHLRSVTVSYNFSSLRASTPIRSGSSLRGTRQTRNSGTVSIPDYRVKHGWRGNFSVEYSNKRLNSDFDFNLYHFTIVRYNQLLSNHNLDFRLEGAFSDRPLPRQRLLYLGGIGTLHGYDFKELVGDNTLLFNVEYRIQFGKIRYMDESEGPLGVVTAFSDTGYAWFNDEDPQFNRFNTSVGVGVSLFIGDPSFVLGLEIARALRKERNFIPILLLSRRF